MKRLPVEISDDIGEYVEKFRQAGYEIIEAKYSSKFFGNFYVDLKKDDRNIRITRDRSQYMVDGNPSELKESELWSAFDSKPEFFNQLFRYLDIENS